MENLYANVNSTKRFYIQKKKDFDRAQEIMRLMPSYAFSAKEKADFTDAYYETPDLFLKEMGVTVRVRGYKNKQIISVKYDEALVKKQDALHKQSIYEQEISPSDSIFNQENLLFIEDKLNVIFAGKLHIDILHKLKSMRAVYMIKTKRRAFEVVHNSGFRANVFFDEIVYTNKLEQIDYNDLIMEIVMTSLSTGFNKQLFENFTDELRKRLILVPMEESKYEAAILFTRFKK